MASQETNIDNFIVKLFEIEAIKFGTFKLKSGIESPVYFDLRVIVSFPDVMNQVAALMWEAIERSGCKFKSICGVPYTALPIATCICVQNNYPMLIRRKEAKDYGTRRMIEGRYDDGDICLIVEDVVTSGSSVRETAQSLQAEKVKVTDAIVLLDREQGGKTALEREGIKLYSVITLSQVLSTLQRMNKLDSDIVDRTIQFIQDNRFDGPAADSKASNGSSIQKVMSHKERAVKCCHPLVRSLYSIMNDKETNLCMSVDFTSSEDLLQLVDKVGPHVCLVKTHIDMLEDFTTDVTQQLQRLAHKHNFLIFEDRKFGDIGKTVHTQYQGGMYKISSWAHITNAHPVPGPGIVSALAEVGKPLGRGCLMVAEMSSSGNLATGEYTKAAVKMAETNKDFVIGFISQSRLSADPDLVHMTPGIKIQMGGDSLGQQYVTPKMAITERGADVIIVGRGITGVSDPVGAAKEYKQAGYSAYLNTLNH
ncbi:uridine 5'-monophosphate synthase-like [Mizuhopecten yessoensis]|uniref:Uridine 5'-monophosphate synthase n=1 Tax=Mizuhopecten yessoensis TaxID=6573 RepID=A0A210QWK7_MIZYE|nr:uridine 5'-monophosphate synthase-like [Mizuhopecten yessoensis]OWF53076.1 Uridine 5'-monophosphate synthase [Mizuhopecten yessoensis]